MPKPKKQYFWSVKNTQQSTEISRRPAEVALFIDDAEVLETTRQALKNCGLPVVIYKLKTLDDLGVTLENNTADLIIVHNPPHHNNPGWLQQLAQIISIVPVVCIEEADTTLDYRGLFYTITPTEITPRVFAQIIPPALRYKTLATLNRHWETESLAQTQLRQLMQQTLGILVFAFLGNDYYTQIPNHTTRTQLLYAGKVKGKRQFVFPINNKVIDWVLNTEAEPTLKFDYKTTTEKYKFIAHRSVDASGTTYLFITQR